jgi:uncharacterized membrane protein YesL
VERLVALNLLWSLQLLPGIMGLAFAGWPLPVRTLLAGYSLLAIMPATLAVYALARRACEGDEVTFEAAVDALYACAVPSMRALAPLLAGLGLLVWATVTVGAVAGLLLLDVFLRVTFLFGVVLSLYWGPLLVEQPQLSPAALLRRSYGLFLKHPVTTLRSGAAVLLTAAVGAVSVGGLFLIVFVLIALLQTHLYLEVGRLEAQGHHQDKEESYG